MVDRATDEKTRQQRFSDVNHMIGESGDVDEFKLGENQNVNIFICYNCHDPLFGRRFVKLDRKPWCVVCYNEQFSVMCIRCGTLIDVDGSDIQYKNSHWHLKCFHCYDCDAALFQKTFSYHDGVLYCPDCHLRKFHQGCSTCDKPFRGGSVMIDYKGKKFHKPCFVCSKCESPLSSGFILEHDSQPFCDSCFAELFAPKCTKCEQPIAKSSDGVFHGKQPYHKECLTCEHCCTSMFEKRYFEYEGVFYCADCFDDPSVFGKYCVGCEELITNDVCSDKFYSVDQSSYWHAQCFKCCRCYEALDPHSSFICPPATEDSDVQAYCDSCGVETLCDMKALVLDKFKKPIRK